MREHLDAAREFETLAHEASTLASGMRRMNAAIYSLRACVDNLRSAAKRGELHLDPPGLDAWLATRIPQARLIRKLRNHHFHEEAVFGTPRMRLSLSIVVPALSMATVGLTVNPNAPGLAIVGAKPDSSSFFLISGWLVQDERESAPVPIPTLVHNQAAELEAHWSALESLLRRTA